MQCCPKNIKTILKMIFFCAMLFVSVWVNTAQGNHLHNVGPWLTDNFHEENNLYNVVLTMLGQHCIGILSIQYVQILMKQYAQENYLCNVGPECADVFLQKNNLYNVVFICLSQHCTRKLPVECWPTAHEKLCTGK